MHSTDYCKRKFVKQLALSAAALSMPGLIGCTAKHTKSSNDFQSRILPAPTNGGFAMDGYWVWGSSVIKGDDGLYHMYADRWPVELGFHAWVTSSEVVHAVSSTPVGPYRFVSVALSRRGARYFDGLVTHNPRVVRFRGNYYLYYFGSTYDYPPPTSSEVAAKDWFKRAWMHKRIGVAVSSTPYGPWRRLDKPILEPRPGHWDASITTNPSPVITSRGRILMMYKSSPSGPEPPLLLGVAEADRPQGPYRRLSEQPVFRFDTEQNKDNDVEDPFVWWAGDRYELIMKDRFGHICGEEGAGIHATSHNGIDWALASPVKAYSRVVKWSDGTTTVQANLERPFILFEDGRATHLFNATGVGSKPWEFERTWNMVTPLA